MVDRISKEQRSKIMASIHSKNTGPEVSIRKALSAISLRYRVHYGKEKIDIAFPKVKVAVFIDGCFWHGCPFHSNIPKTNQEYWLPKLKRNIERDKEKNKRLEEDGWLIIHVWEHEIENASKIAEIIKNTVQNRKVACG